LLAVLLAALLLPALHAESGRAAHHPAGVRAGALSVVINEILAHTDPPQVDSVELYNPNDQPVAVGGWCLSDDADDPCPAGGILGDGTAVPARGYLVLAVEPLGFRLSENGETLTLTARSGGQPTGYVHHVAFGPSPNGVSFGRVLTSDGREHFALQKEVTLGSHNAGPRLGDLRIAEIMYHPAGGRPEYVAIANVGATALPLHDPARPHAAWQVDGVGALILPPGLWLAPGESLYVTDVAPEEFRTAYTLPDSVQVAGPYGGQLQDDGETVALLAPGAPNPDGTFDLPIAADAVTYGVQAPWPLAPNGGGPALQRLPPGLPQRLGGFGEEPHNWRVAPVPLEATAPAPAGVRLRVVAQPTGWLLAWSSVSEARVTGWRLWRAANGVRDDAVPVGDGGQGSIVVAQGGRHAGGTYRLPDLTADHETAYNYWLEAVGDDGAVLAATAVAPTHALFLPSVRH
jgi:hypothetical protein